LPVALASSLCGSAYAQGLNGAAEAFPSGQPLSSVTSPLGLATAPTLGTQSGAIDLARAIQGVPMHGEGAARLQRLLGVVLPGDAAVPGSAPLAPVGAAVSSIGLPNAGAVTMPGFVPSQDASNRIDGASNLIRAVPGALLPVP
jgi:hypothetical protein